MKSQHYKDFLHFWWRFDDIQNQIGSFQQSKSFNLNIYTHAVLSVKKAESPLRQIEWKQWAGWSSVGDNNMTTCMALPRRPISQGETENRELCGPYMSSSCHMNIFTCQKREITVHLCVRAAGCIWNPTSQWGVFILCPLSHCTADTSTF